MKVKQVEGLENVPTAVWLATSVLTYDKCNTIINFTENDAYLKQIIIRDIAEQMINRIHPVDNWKNHLV